MSIFIAPAFAAHAPTGPSLLEGFMPVILVIIIAYFIIIRPQQKRSKAQRDMMNALEKGDEVLTSSGMLGRIVKAEEHYFLLEIAHDVHILVQKMAVVQKLDKGTIKKMMH